ncbi:hypothetical protein Drorol1_Dr00007788 [Drosera rotundifolia]
MGWPAIAGRSLGGGGGAEKRSEQRNQAGPQHPQQNPAWHRDVPNQMSPAPPRNRKRSSAAVDWERDPPRRRLGFPSLAASPLSRKRNVVAVNRKRREDRHFDSQASGPREVCRVENRRLEKDSPPPREEKFARDPQAAK